MGIITTCIISFSLVALNYGFRAGFLKVWLRSWSVSYILAVLVIFFVGPWVQVFVNFLLKKTEVHVKKRRHRMTDSLSRTKNSLQQ
jgi:hypothetical protein